MSLNVLHYFPAPKHYYIMHPWEWFKQIFNNLKMARQRVEKGYCSRDLWDFDHFLLSMLPEALNEFADNNIGYPGTEDFPTFESWTDWLRATADVLISLQEENWRTRNEYQILLSNEDDDLRELWWEREKELSHQRQELIEDTFAELAHNLTAIWW